MFNFANWEFLTNCRRLADHAYPLYSWRRYRARLVADALHDFVAGPGGWAAWREAADKNLPARASAINTQRTLLKKLNLLFPKRDMRQVQREPLTTNYRKETEQ